VKIACSCDSTRQTPRGSWKRTIEWVETTQTSELLLLRSTWSSFRLLGTSHLCPSTRTTAAIGLGYIYFCIVPYYVYMNATNCKPCRTCKLRLTALGFGGIQNLNEQKHVPSRSWLAQAQTHSSLHRQRQTLLATKSVWLQTTEMGRPTGISG